MEAFGLSRRLGVPVSVAKEVMDKYFAGFPSLRAYMDQTIKDIRAKGYSRTEFGRIRPFPDIATATGPQRQAAERQAMNSGIQGLAADVFKSRSCAWTVSCAPRICGRDSSSRSTMRYWSKRRTKRRRASRP